ncbi:MAG: cupredoxin domain-containing protein [Actinomycetota bacterium]
MKRFLPLAIILVMLATACGGDEGPSREDPLTFKVSLDPAVKGRNVSFLTFLPNEISARQGDKVEFTLDKYNGEPHAVALGKLVDEGIESLRKLGPTAPAARQEEALSKLPDPFPHQPPPDAPRKMNQSGARPCFLASGDPPNDLAGGAPACNETDQPDFTGEQSFYSGGLLADDGMHFDVNIAADAKPGNYTFMCLVHRGSMTGALTVLERSRGVLEPDKDVERGRTQAAELTEEVTRAVDKAKGAGPEAVSAGVGTADGRAQALEFVPREVTVASGGTVTWNVTGFHTVSFGLSEEDLGPFTKDDKGNFELNRKLRPVNSPPLPPEYQSFPPTTDKPLALDGGRFIGVGLKNSGVLGSLPPALISYKVTFAQPGTYTVFCQVHPAMTGTVRVT